MDTFLYTYILCWQSSLTFFVDIFILAHHKGVLMALSISIRFDSLWGSCILYVKKLNKRGWEIGLVAAAMLSDTLSAVHTEQCENTPKYFVTRFHMVFVPR